MGVKQHAGFTLIELLVVVAVIGILGALLFSNFAGARERARDIKRKSDLVEIKKALRLYYNDYQRYPGNSGNQIAGCGAGNPPSTACPWGSAFTSGTTVYMNQLPEDPINSAPYEYVYTVVSGGGTNDAFLLQADLENEGDPDIAQSQSRCATEVTALGLNLTNEYVVCGE